MAFHKSEPVAQALRDHQTALADWPYAGFARELHRWTELFDIEFKLQLPAYPVIRFAKLRNAYATYGCFRGEIGTKDNITFNTHELVGRDPALILRTHCHELLHLWQQYHGTPSPWNYHNVEFREKALSCGLLVDPRGCTTGHTEIFTAVLAKYGVHLEPLAAEMRLYGASKREQKLKKWTCRCTIVRCATTLKAECTHCQQPFVMTTGLPMVEQTKHHQQAVREAKGTSISPEQANEELRRFLEVEEE
jgi:hypothetical protein